MADKTLGTLDRAIKKEFDSNQRILTFDEYLGLVTENPERHTRGSAQYMVEMMDHFGRDTHEGLLPRFKLFDMPIDGHTPKVVGQEAVQNQLYRCFQTFTRQGFSNKLLLLHGPNGSAKSSISHALMGAIERYCREPQGATYSFHWVFPVERLTKGGIGIGPSSSKEEHTDSYAKLPDEELAALVPCELQDHPLLLIPQEHRLAFLSDLLGVAPAKKLWESMPTYLKDGDLCHRCRQIYDALLKASFGDMRRILRHIRVERTYFSRRYRRGLVTIEPQMHVDAQFHQLTYNRSVSALPTSLQNINLFSLSGDLIDGNRGLIEYCDLLKRPIDTFKYLLGVCETGSVGIGTAIAYLDTLMLGSTNELQLDAFKEFADFPSFKARIELIRVPYLLRAVEEEQIYAPQLEHMGIDKHVAPYVALTAAHWAVLTRLKKPNSINYPPNLNTIVSNITPIEKLRLYDTGEMPASLSPEDRKLLRVSLSRIKDEYNNVPYYEGRMGASAREIRTILHSAAQNPDFPCLTPLAFFKELESFVKRVSEYDFLKQDVKDGYHDASEFINTVRAEYLNRVDKEVRDAMGLYNFTQWEDFLKKYVQQISTILKKEKVKNPLTGKHEDVELALVEELEAIVGAPTDETEKDSFRKNIISQVGVWSLDHPKEPVIYSKVFPEYWQKLEKHYFESQKAVLTKMHDALLVYDTEADDRSSEGAKLAQQTISNMKSRLGYCEKCAKEVIIFLMRQRY